MTIFIKPEGIKSENDYIIMVTAHGLIKRVFINELELAKPKKLDRAAGVQVITIREKDSLIAVRHCRIEDSIIVATKYVNVIVFLLF